MTLVVFIELGGRNIKAPPPDMHLFLTVLLDCFKFVKALKCSVMPLIEPPGFDDWDVVTIEFLGCVVEGLDGAGEDRGITKVECEPILLEGFACLGGFLDA